jgi:hypothetical protein
VRLGCFGCLTSLVLSVLAIATVGVVAWAVIGALQSPDVKLVAPTQADWVSAQQKLYGLGRSTRGRVVLSERELTAVAARRLEDAAALPIADVTVRVRGDGGIEVVGQVPLRMVVAETSLRGTLGILPASWLERPLWMQLRARPRVEERAGERRYLRLDVEAFALGRRFLPAFLSRLILDPSVLGLLRIALPEEVEAVSTEPGRIVIRSGG